MKLVIAKNEFWIKFNEEFPSNFDSMNDDEKLNYIYGNKLLHREDGPAIINSDMYQAWWLNGKRHRLDGPAMIWSNGEKWWFLNDIRVDREIYQKIQNSLKEELLVYMIDPKYKDYISLIEYRLSL